MADTSNPTERVMDVLTFLGAHPTDSFNLAEIAKRLELSKATAHRILTTMAEARFLSRNEKHKTYSLGLALVALGRAAQEKHRGIEVARREIARLALDLKVQCSVTAVADDELLLLAKEGSPQTHDGVHQVGERAPIVPTIAIGHIAWCPDPAVQAYLSKAAPYLSESLRTHWLASVPIIRQRGFAIAANGPARRKLGQAMNVGLGHARNEKYWAGLRESAANVSNNELQITDLDNIGDESISYISTPIFSPDGSVSLELVITGLPKGVARPEIENCAARLQAAAAIVTGEVHGRRPEF